MYHPAFHLSELSRGDVRQAAGRAKPERCLWCQVEGGISDEEILKGKVWCMKLEASLQDPEEVERCPVFQPGEEKFCPCALGQLGTDKWKD